MHSCLEFCVPGIPVLPSMVCACLCMYVNMYVCIYACMRVDMYVRGHVGM